MARLMCFRPSKKYKNKGDDAYGTITKETANVAPNGCMVSRDISNDGLTLQYITARIIVLSCDEPDNQKYVESLKTASAALKNKHFDHYKVWNVSRRREDVRRILGAEESGWPRGLAPPLDRLCAVCKQIEQWLNLHPQNVVVIHCKGDRSRAAQILAAHIYYNAICGNDDPVEDRFNMKRFTDQHIGGSGQPSARRYINYFSSLLSGRVVVNPNPLFLLRLAVSHLNGRMLAFKIYERLVPVYESTSSQAKDVLRWDIDGELKLRGDILVKVFHYSEKGEKKKELFLCQLNTCSLELKARTASLTFHKEELDLIFNDPSIHNDVVLELLVSFDPPKPSAKKQNGHLEGTRTNSYEDFQQPEDEPLSNGVVYSEIKKEGKKAKEPTTMPPPVPPKPRSHSAMAEPIADMPERRGVLPAQVRPVAHRPPSPRTAAERATPSIEPDLVGKDRYDKASKCFSYAPKKELSEAFERPRKPSFSRNSEPKVEEQINHVDPSEAARVAITPTQVLKPVEPTMKWDDEVEKAKQDALLDQLSRMPIRSHSVAGQPYYQRKDEDEEERPVIVEQAQRAVATTTPTGTLNRNHRSTNYGSYKTLHDDRFSSAMDDLCDPDFYMNYKAPSANSAPVPPPRHAGAKSVELPRRRFQPVETFTDPLDEILNTTAGSCQDLSKDREAFRTRNCKSVAAAPSRERKLFARNYDATEEARDPDDWLSTQLRKVRSKRNLDPDLVRRRTQEKMLLEELKNVNDEKDGRNDYVVDGYGHKADPLAEFRREEERLRNTNSPFQDGSRRSRGVRSKPPTPPPRDRSRSPARSEVATPSIDSHTYRHINGYGGSQNQENEDFDFSTLSSIVQPAFSGRASRSLNRKPSFGNERPPFNYQDKTQFFSGQERVAAAISRAETPQRDMYASGTIYRPETPSRYHPENTTMAQRSATPSFPRETPIPFHPLLYSQNGSSRAEMDRDQTLNYRSSSPRSQYGQLSRRSSLTSVDTSEIIHHHPVFVKDTSKYWYKPNISREAAINMLRDKQPGTFVVRDSNSFPGAFGLALKVAQPPPGVASGDGTELVRHFLIEPSPKGVKLKGCNNEPVFGSLSALVYQHSITPLALPTKLLLPEYDPASTPEHVSATQALLEQGAACNVTFIGTVDVESLTGTECVRRAIAQAVQDSQHGLSRPVSVHFKVSSQGITLTDNTRKVFFRRHFPVNNVIFAGMDPSDRRFDNYIVLGYSETCVPSARMFAFVARKPSSMENSCHVFAELEPEQPGSAVINFINKVMLSNRRP